MLVRGRDEADSTQELDPSKFKLLTLNRVIREGSENIEISELDIRNMDFITLRDYFKKLWG